MTNTTFYIVGNKTKRLVDNMTQKEMEQELRGNGFKVVKSFKGDVSFEQFEQWEFMNRNRR